MTVTAYVVVESLKTEGNTVLTLVPPLDVTVVALGETMLFSI